MDEDEKAFPMDFYAEDLSPRPWKFRPEGYLVVILSDAGEAQRAEASLIRHGFAPRDIKLYTGKQILENYEVYRGRRNATDKVIGSVVDDSEGKELYLAYAGEDRCAMWVRIPDERGCAESPSSRRRPRLRPHALLRLRPTDRLQRFLTQGWGVLSPARRSKDRARVAASPSSPSRRRVQRRFPCLRYPPSLIGPFRSLCVDLGTMVPHTLGSGDHLDERLDLPPEVMHGA